MDLTSSTICTDLGLPATRKGVAMRLGAQPAGMLAALIVGR